MKRTAWFLGFLVVLALGAGPANAATRYTVSGTGDAPGATCTGTVCASLRAAVSDVPAGSTIQLGPGIYKLSGVLLIGQSETIAGVSPSQTTIQQTEAGDGVIEASVGNLALSGLTVTGGSKLGKSGFDQHAGGIFTAGTGLTLDHVSVTNNTATGYKGVGGSGGGDAVGGIQIDGSSTVLTISDSSITNNTATGGDGANVTNGNGGPGGTAYGALSDFAAAATITNTLISGNTATGGNGGTASGNVGFSGGLSGQADGAITIIAHPSSSTTLIAGSTIANNTSIGGKGGNGVGTSNVPRGGNGNTVFGALSGGGNTLKVVSSTVSGNTGRPATGGTGSTTGSAGSVVGGGVSIGSGSAALINSTIAGNVATGANGEGGGVDMRSTGALVMAADTVFGNTAGEGGNLYASSSQFRINSTIIAGGVQTTTGGIASGNCLLDSVTETDFGDNLESTTPSQCGFSPAKSDVFGESPQLAALASNGGPTTTMALGGTSPAIGHGGDCNDISQSGSAPLTVDQRGLPRVSPCDIGAFQHQPVVEQTAPAISGSPTFGGTLSCSPGTWTGDGLSYAYQWTRNGSRIAGQTGRTHVVSVVDFGSQLGCAVTATGTYGHAGATATLAMPPNCNCTPAITKLAQSHRSWRRGSALAHLTALAASRPPVGTTFRFRLDRAATVTLSFTRTSPGRVVRGRCVAVTKTNRHGKSCTRSAAAGRLSFTAHAGANRIAFAGRLSRRKRLATGPYLLGVTAALRGGPSSRPSSLRFSVVG